MQLPSLFQVKKTQTNTETNQSPETVNVSPTAQDLLIKGLVSIKDIIAPEAIEVDFSYLKLSNVYTQTLFIAGYPRFVTANWLSPLINFNHSLDIAMHIFPVDGKSIMDDLRRKITEMEAEIQSDIRRGRIANIDTQVKLEDARVLQEQLAKGAERFYQFGLYVTISADSLDELHTISSQVQSMLASLLIVSKRASLQMEEAFKTTLPEGVDRLQYTRNMDTTSLATTFPFTSSDLTSDSGILYGINEHNDSLVIFDRFNLENANMVVFAKSGSGKSYAVKLECLRSLMFGTEVIIIDPEGEYVDMAKAVGGDYVNFSFNSPIKINPFDLSTVYDPEENELGLKILSLHTLMKIMLGQMSPEEEAILDRALVATYQSKGITPDPATQANPPPLMEDLYKVLMGMENEPAQNIANRLEKFIRGSFRGIFDQSSSLTVNSPFTVFGIKDMEDALRPIAMFIILDFIWTRVKKDLKRRLLVVDEAWYLMQFPDSAAFLYGIAKRARKYYLGVTTITQDVEDFLTTDQGKAIVTNSSLQLLMKQSPAALDGLTHTFNLSEGERRLLLSADVGEGLFFAAQNHVALRIVSSPEEHQLITSKPQEIVARRAQQAAINSPRPPVNLTNPASPISASPTPSFSNQRSSSNPFQVQVINPSPSPVSSPPAISPTPNTAATTFQTQVENIPVTQSTAAVQSDYAMPAPPPITAQKIK